MKLLGRLLAGLTMLSWPVVLPALLLPALLLPALASAQDFPAKPIKLIVPFPAGGPNDIIARVIGQRMSEIAKQPVLIRALASVRRASALAAPTTVRALVVVEEDLLEVLDQPRLDQAPKLGARHPFLSLLIATARPATVATSPLPMCAVSCSVAV